MKHRNESGMIFDFIREITKNNYKNVAIVTDKDGTIILNEYLKCALNNLKGNDYMRMWLIANSGRTIGDMISCLKVEQIPLDIFDYVVGDNGGMCITTNPKTNLFKSCMEKKVGFEIIEKFLNLGGTLENIRIADGEEIYAQKSKDVKKYYKNRDSVVFKKNIKNANVNELTKITLTGDEELIDSIIEYINENYKKCKVHKGKTAFPKKEANNYRVDVTGNHDKGKATQYFREKLNLERCICLGNDFNDLSMFYNAVENNDYIVIAENQNNDTAEELKESILAYISRNSLKYDDKKMLIIDELNMTKFLRKIGSFLKKNSYKKRTEREKFINKIKKGNFQLSKSIVPEKIVSIQSKIIKTKNLEKDANL